ncbi:hypothetical protein [Streptomyces mirabilis]
MSTTVRRTAAALCTPGKDAVSRCRRTLEALSGRGLARWYPAG